MIYLHYINPNILEVLDQKALFLWIIEKENNFKPVNKSYLLNKFLQYILEGLIIDESKAGAFNFERKKEVLAEISYEMFQRSDASKNYSMHKDDIVSVISKYFKANQRNLDANEVFNEFFDKGIFKIESDNNKFTFRFESFFQFFLSLNIETKEDFRKKILSDDEVLSFIDELDYYTGRNQRDKSILEFSINLLERSFVEIDKIIEDDVDKYFPKNAIVLNRIDTSKIQAGDLRKSKLTDEEINKSLDKEMDRLPIDNSLRIKKKYNHTKHFYLSLELSARVLKNAENIQDPELINRSLDLILEKNAKYCVLVRSLMVKTFRDDRQFPAFMARDFMLASAPLINQVLIYSFLATDFLQSPLERKLNELLNSKHKNEYLLFVVNFIFTDLQLRNYIHYTNESIKKITSKFMAELFLFKILTIYMYKPDKSSILPSLEDQLVTLLMKVRGINKSDARKFVESNVRKQKKEKAKDEDSEIL